MMAVFITKVVLAMSNKKYKFLAVAASLVLLAGCSELIALPTNYEEKLFDNLVTDIERNVASVVYDAIREGDATNNEVLNDVLYLIAEDKFGTYEDNKSSVDADVITFMNTVNQRVNIKMYEMITTGAYETRNIFREERFADYIKQQLHPLDFDPDVDQFAEPYIFLPATTEQIASGEILDEAINIDYYTTYIEKELVPTIYRELLIEEYVIDENYATIGRTYGRKVNYVAIKRNDNYPEAAKYLLDTFIDQYIRNPIDPSVPVDLELIARAWRGVILDNTGQPVSIDTLDGTPEKQLLLDSGLLSGGINRTLYGDIKRDYDKINDDALLTDKEIENDFTDNGRHHPDVGLENKLITLLKRDFTIDGWHIKNGGLTALPTNIRNRVFNIGVANSVDRASLVDESTPGFNPNTLLANQKSDFVRLINGNYYLIPQTSELDDPRDFLLYDSGSQTYYIVMIEEALNTTKMNPSETSESNYDAIDGGDSARRLNIAQEIAKILAKTDANKNAAMDFLLKEFSIIFHDEKVYEFFFNKFPNVYDSE
jgi:hypothetical protein